MNNETNLTLFDSELPQGQSDQEVAEFRYEVLDPEDREFVQKKEYEIHTHWDRASDEILASGEKLLLVQKRLKDANKGKHGSFEGWLEKSGLSRTNAFFAMKAYNRFGDGKKFVSQTFSKGALHSLTYASDEVVAQVIAGEVRPTQMAIREAEKKQREAEEKAKQARAAESKAKAEAVAAQQQLFLLQQTSQTEIDELTKQMNKLKDELDNVFIPEPEIRYVDKEVVPQSVKNNMEDLQRQIAKLSTDLYTAKNTVPQKTLDQIKELQTQLLTYKTLVDAKEKSLNEIRGHNAKIAEMNKKLSEEARLMSAETQAVVGRARIRQKWREDTKDLHVAIAKFIAEIPSLIDQESLEGDDWARQAECVEILQRAISTLKQMRNNQSDPFIESEFVAATAATTTGISRFVDANPTHTVEGSWS